MTPADRTVRSLPPAVPSHKELVREIAFLRSVARDIIDRYALRINASLADQARILEAPATRRYAAKKPNDKTAREMIARIRSLKVKPKKGRAKDLARIERLVGRLADLMPPQP